MSKVSVKSGEQRRDLVAWRRLVYRVAVRRFGGKRKSGSMFGCFGAFGVRIGVFAVLVGLLWPTGAFAIDQTRLQATPEADGAGYRLRLDLVSGGSAATRTTKIPDDALRRNLAEAISPDEVDNTRHLIESAVSKGLQPLIKRQQRLNEVLIEKYAPCEGASAEAKRGLGEITFSDIDEEGFADPSKKHCVLVPQGAPELAAMFKLGGAMMLAPVRMAHEAERQVGISVLILRQKSVWDEKVWVMRPFYAGAVDDSAAVLQPVSQFVQSKFSHRDLRSEWKSRRGWSNESPPYQPY
jgi:hypothetical protein